MWMTQYGKTLAGLLSHSAPLRTMLHARKLGGLVVEGGKARGD